MTCNQQEIKERLGAVLGQWPGPMVEVDIVVRDLDVEALHAERCRLTIVHRRAANIEDILAYVDRKTLPLRERLKLPIRFVQLTNAEADIRSNDEPIYYGDAFVLWSPGIPTASVRLHYTVSR